MARKHAGIFFLRRYLFLKAHRLFAVPVRFVDWPPSWSFEIQNTRGYGWWGWQRRGEDAPPSPPATGFFFTLPSFARIKRPRWRSVDMYVVTEKKGNCEQSTKLTDFLLRSRKTVRFSEHIMSVVQISEHISAPNGVFVYLFRGQSCCCTRFRILRVRLHV